MLPLSTVESQAFRKLINGICPTQIPDRKSFTEYLDHQYDLGMDKVKATLVAAGSVSTTADLWTCHNCSYMGMTVHWIEPSTCKRRKAAITCCRVTGRHTYDVVASKIECAHVSYNIAGKVTATVTDNGSNPKLLQHFKHYQIQWRPHHLKQKIRKKWKLLLLKMWMNC